MRLRRCYDILKHHGERLTPVDGRVGEPFEDRVNLVPDGLPFGAFASQVEFGQHAFEPIDNFGMALKPWTPRHSSTKASISSIALLPAVLSMPHHRRAVRILDLEPILRTPRPVGRAQSLRHNALQAHAAGLPEDGDAVVAGVSA
jgi:hypothetical protein